MVASRAGVFVYTDIKRGFKFEGCGYLETQLTFLAEGRYSITIRYMAEDQEKSVSITGKGLSRITISTDRFTIERVESEKPLKVVINNIKDYFFDVLSEN